MRYYTARATAKSAAAASPSRPASLARSSKHQIVSTNTTETVSATRGAPGLRWSTIDTVLLDMDGTLLDLHYDNHIWNSVVPTRVASRQLDLEQPSREQIEACAAPLLAEMMAVKGNLEFYDLHYWGDRTELDMVALHHEFASLIRYRPGAEAFLRALASSKKQVILATNAHRDCLGVKHHRLGLLEHFDIVVSAHDYGAPKEDQHFWQSLKRAHPFDPARALFIDDNQQVLAAAAAFGIAEVRCVLQPDLHTPPQATGGYLAVDDLSELLPIAGATGT